MIFCQEQNNIIFYSNQKCSNKINSKDEIDTEAQNQRLFTLNVMAEVLTVSTHIWGKVK